MIKNEQELEIERRNLESSNNANFEEINTWPINHPVIKLELELNAELKGKMIKEW